MRDFTLWGFDSRLSFQRNNLKSIGDANSAGVFGANGLFYVIGGSAQSQAAVSQVMAFDPSSDTWVIEPSLPVPLARGEAVETRSGEIVYAGGTTLIGKISSLMWELNTK